MNDDDELKKLWKEEAEQQRQDNKKKQRVYKKREVDIKFGGVKKNKTSSSLDSPGRHTSSKDGAVQDDFLRATLGL